MKALICYYSRGGTTEAMANAIAEGMRENSVSVEVKRVQDASPKGLPEYDALILGSPTYYGLPAAQIKEYLDESVQHHGKLSGMVGGAFASSANPAGGNETTIMALIQALMIHGMIVQGKVDGDHYGPVVVGDPTDEELEQCRDYGKLVADLVGRVVE